MSGGVPGWFSAATAAGVLHMLGFESPVLKQFVFGGVLAARFHPELVRAWTVKYGLHMLHYAAAACILIVSLRAILSASNVTTSAWTGNTKVLLLPCKTTHARLFPKKHSFDYSYLVVGIPVGWEGIAGGLVSSSSKKQPWYSWSRRGWYHVNPADYLYRGDGHLGLREKLNAYLVSQVRSFSQNNSTLTQISH